MKKFYIISIALSLLAICNLNAQRIQASMGPGSAPNRVKIYIRSAVNIPAVNISTLQFNVAVSIAAAPAPTVTVATNNIPSAIWIVETAIEGGYNNYMIQNSGAVGAFALTANVDFEAMEINFAGGPLLTSDVALVTLPDGGAGLTMGKALFLATGPVFSDGASLYYARSGVVVSNGNSYDQVSGAPGTTTSTATIGNISLPTKFLSFFANKKDDNADLIWTVDNEENNAYFDIQRSVDGRVFTDVTRVNALRNGRTSNTYTIPDVNISRLGSKILYYRIKQVETSGEIVFSEVRQLNLTTKNFTIGLYPNPVVSATKLVVDAPEAGKAFIIIRDAAGKTVQQINMEFVKGVNQKELNASMLPAGDYNVTVMGEKFNQTIKMTKAN